MINWIVNKIIFRKLFDLLKTLLYSRYNHQRANCSGECQIGYTTYFTQKQSFTTNDWNELKRILPLIITESGITICGPLGEDNPIINDNLISFNGCAENAEDYETFEISKKHNPQFNFCKTQLRPYDIVVCALLTVINAIAPNVLDISSDGNSEDWNAGVLLASKVMDKDMICPVK